MGTDRTGVVVWETSGLETSGLVWETSGLVWKTSGRRLVHYRQTVIPWANRELGLTDPQSSIFLLFGNWPIGIDVGE